MRPRPVLSLALPLLGVVACNQIFGLQEGALADAGGSFSPPAVGCPENCVPRAPVGWTGPMVLAKGEATSAPRCTEPYAVESFVAHRDLKVETMKCSVCTSTLTDEKCTTVATVYSDSNCQTAVGSQSFVASAATIPCLETSTYGKSLRFGAPSISGKCSPPPPQTPTKPMPTWGSTVRGCSPQTLEACSNAPECVAAVAGGPASAQTCIFAVGEQACPLDYPTKLATAFQSFDDQRSCEECGVQYIGGDCGSGVGGSYVSPTCSGNVQGYYSFGTCSYADAQGTTVTAGMLLDGFRPYNVGACAVSTPKPEGAVTPRGPVSICCR